MQDSKDLRKTKDYTRIVHLLRLFVNSLTRLIDCWEEFSSLHLASNQELRFLNVHKFNISQELKQLKTFRLHFQQNLDVFDGLRSSVCISSQKAPAFKSG